jgi:hypothetical protein
MHSMRAMRVFLALALILVGASTASAQVDLAVTGGLDVTNRYMFRGIRQNGGEVSIWPYIDLGIPAWSGDGGLKSVTLNLGTWNAFHTELPDNKWYESDLYATLGFGFSKAALSFNYTSYTSPADIFAHVKEFGIKLGFDDSAALGKGALKPYVMVAFELSDSGQADAGSSKGTYVELGVAPGYAGSKASIAFPIKVGLSGSNYYEFATGSDSKFGYFSIGGIVTVPLGAHANVHGGVEVQTFGDNVKAYNGQDAAGLASIGIGFSF